MLNLCFK